MNNLDKLLNYLHESPDLESRAMKLAAADGERSKMKLVYMWVKQGVISFEEFSALTNLLKRKI